MAFFKEEIRAFNIAYFDNTCAALDSEKGMQYFCRDVFKQGIVPDLDKEALDIITRDLTHRFMYDTSKKRSRWGLVSIPHDLLTQCAERILAKVVVRRRPKEEAEDEARRKAEEAERGRKAMEEKMAIVMASETFHQYQAETEARCRDEARRQAEERLRVETEPKAIELRRRAGEIFRRLAEEPYNEEEVARMTESHPMRARFSSLEELIAVITVMNAKGGRDLFVADLVKNHGRTLEKPRKRNVGDNDGVIYAIISRVDLKVYVGQTKNFDTRIRAHFNASGSELRIKDAIRNHDRKIFVSVILLAGIEGDRERDSAEIAAIQYLDCLSWNGRGYNKNHGGRRGGSNY